MTVELTDVVFDVPACRVCHCTDAEACPLGCWWVADPAGEGDLCSACLTLATALLEITSVLEETRFVWSSEVDLQTGIQAVLVARGLDVEREVRVDARNRLDLRVGRVGIEVKIAGGWRDVRRQLERYALLDVVDALVLVTSKPAHARIADEVGGCPVVVYRVGSSL
jgi:hypothetical protein